MNNLLKILLIFILALTFFCLSFASTSLSISSDKTNYTLWEIINVNVSISGWEIDYFELDSITWIENFDILRRSSSSSIQIINWVRNTNVNFILSLLPKNSWNFILWPAYIKNWNIKSNFLNIKIISSQESINNKLKDNKNDTQNITWKSYEKSDKIDKSNQELYDINDIEGVKQFFPKNLLFYPIILFLFFLIFYLFLVKYLNSQKKKDVEKIDKKIKTYDKDSITHIILELESLEKNFLETEKNIFYEKLNSIFRKYFKFLWLELAENMSLKELEVKTLKLGIKNWNFLEIFKESYFLEFDSKNDNPKIRENIIGEFMQELRK